MSGNIKANSLPDNTMTGNKQGPIVLHSNQIGMIDSASHYTGNGLDRVDFDGTIDAKTTVHPIDVPYFVESNSNFYVDAPVVVEPGVHFEFGQGAWFSVETAGGLGNLGGSFKAVGTATNMITFDGVNHTPGYWGARVPARAPATALARRCSERASPRRGRRAASRRARRSRRAHGPVRASRAAIRDPVQTQARERARRTAREWSGRRTRNP